MRRNLSLQVGSVFVLLLAIAPASAEAPVDSILDRASQQVSAFLEQVSEVKCTEQVAQVKLDKKGHPEYTTNSTFDYLVLMEGTADDLLLNESRIPAGQTGKPARNVSLLVSNGFSTLFLIFHPYYRNSFQFESEGEDVIEGRRMLRVGFTRVAGKRTPAALAVRGREYPLPLAGTAWIDADSGMIARIAAHLADDMHDVGLRSLTAQIDYAPIKLPGWAQIYRFPVLATVDVETLRQHWHNVHRFSEYKHFMVGTEVTKTEQK